MAKSIKDLLGSLHVKTYETDLEEWCLELCDFYKENDRHSYAEITEFILSDQGGLDYVYEIIPILKTVLERFRARGDRDMCKRVGKLIDHLQLEELRLNYIGENITGEVQKQFVELNNLHIQQLDSLRSDSERMLEGARSLNEAMKEQIDKNQQLLEESKERQETVNCDLEETKRRLEETKQKLEETTERLEATKTMAGEAQDKVESTHRDSITILGIFAAIVLAFTGGMVFSTSVFENLHKSSFYNVVIISLLIGLVLFNVMGILLYSLRQIQNSKLKSEYRIYTAGNVILLILLIAALVLKVHSPEYLVQNRRVTLERLQVEQEIEELESKARADVPDDGMAASSPAEN